MDGSAQIRTLFGCVNLYGKLDSAVVLFIVEKAESYFEIICIHVRYTWTLSL